MSRYNLPRGFAAVPILLAGLSLAGCAQLDRVREPVAASCESVGTQGAPGCSVEEYLLAILEARGVVSAMAVLDSLAARDEQVRRDGHGYAHAIGITAFAGDEEVADVFSRCTPAFQSGCYHGVIQAYFTRHQQAHGGHIDVATVNELCRAHREGADRWLLFQCAHGMGHGLLTIADNHLPAALEMCDLVADDWERPSCYGGVFMENIVHETAPHHAIGRPDSGGEHAVHDEHSGHGDHAGHAMTTPTASVREEFPPLKRDDPLYPCSVLEDRYLVSCYQMQTSVILHFNGSDVAAAAESCVAAQETLRPVCFQSLGRDISSITLQDHPRAISLCSHAPSEYQPWCILGYAKNLVDVTANPVDGFAFCRLLPPGESKRVCNVAIGEQIWVLTDDRGQRESMCLEAEPAFLQACRYGARVAEGSP